MRTEDIERHLIAGFAMTLTVICLPCNASDSFAVLDILEVYIAYPEDGYAHHLLLNR